MKTIQVKSYIINTLQEAAPIFAKDKAEEVKLRQRAVNARRLSKEARKAAKEAEANGNTDLANNLNNRADELDELAKNINIDILNTDSDTDDNEADDATAKNDQQDGAGKSQDSQNDDGNEEGEAPNWDDELDSEDSGNQSQNQQNKNDKNGQASQDERDFNLDSNLPPRKGGPKQNNSNQESDNDANSNSSSSSSEDDSEQEQDQKGNGQGKDKDDQESDNEDGADEGEGEKDSEEKDSKNKSKSKGKGGNSQGNDQDEEDEESEEDEDDSDSDSENQNGGNSKQGKNGKSKNPPKKDIFANEEDIPQEPSFDPNGQPQEPEDPTIDDIIKQLQDLTGEAKRGAIDGLKDLLSGKKTESLHEDILTEEEKNLRNMTDDEFGDLINDTIDMIEKVHKVDTINDLADRQARISSWKNSNIAKRELEQEITEPAKAERRVQTRQAEVAKYGNYMTLEEFKMSFSEAIKNQVEEVLREYQTYDEINTEYEDEDIIMKADVDRLELDDKVPIIDIYFDQSSSWDYRQVDIGKRLIATVKKRYADEGLCKLNIWYFADRVGPRPSGIGGGTSAWPDIIENIQSTGADNVVVMTDDDMNNWGAERGPTVTVEGCVWWIWKDMKRAENCVKHLRGRSGNYEAAFRTGESMSWDQD